MKKRLGHDLSRMIPLIFLIMLLSSAVQASDDNLLSAGKADEPGLYLIRLADPPLAIQQARRSSKRLDVRTDQSKAYRKKLSDRQDEVKAAAENIIGRGLAPVYRYDVVYNGMAISLTPGEAAEIAEIPGVVSVHRDEPHRLMTDASPEFLNAPAIWEGSVTGGLGGTKGEGIIIGIIDTGIWPEHPCFADDGTYPEPPAKWGGKCKLPADSSQGYKCSNKLIGIQFYLSGYISWAGKYDGLFQSGRDDNGHGTHVASTAGGNENVPAQMYGIDRGKISGMAPRAHIAAYKVAGPQGVMTSDSVAAIDKAVADGVDVINYSVGRDTATDPWTDDESLAFLAAREAGVFVAAIAGNDGPDSGTVCIPGNAPWVTTVAATYSSRLYISEMTLDGPGTPPSGIYGITQTKGIRKFNLVNAEGIADIKDDTSGSCRNPFPTGAFRSTDAVLCKGGGKGDFVQDGGGGAIILYNHKGLYDYFLDSHSVPALFVLRESGLVIREYLRQHPGEVSVSFTQGQSVSAPDSRIPADIVAGFSSRGPDMNAADNKRINVIKPDIAAPGVQILAGASPEFISYINGTAQRLGHQGELFQVRQGTSMAAPHVAGLAALIKALRPEWTPGQIQSAMMTTAVSENIKARGEEGDMPATPFDTGAGRVDVSAAVSAGFVLDETGDNFMAANPAEGGDPSALNLPALINDDCMGECSWTRTLQSTADVEINWSVVRGEGSEANPSPLTSNPLPLTITPSTFTLQPGATQEIRITAHVSDLLSAEWAFSEIGFAGQGSEVRGEGSEVSPEPRTSNPLPPSHFPVAVLPIKGRMPAETIEIETRRNQGTYKIKGLKAVSSAQPDFSLYVGIPETVPVSLAQDSTNDNVYDDFNDGVFVHLFHVPDSVKKFTVQTLNATAQDLDLYVGMDENSNGLPDPAEQLCRSANSLPTESCSFPKTGETLEPGTYWIAVQNWKGSADEDTFDLVITAFDKYRQGPVTVSGPTSISFNIPFDLTISYNIPDMKSGDVRTGWIEIGTDALHPGNIGTLPFTLSRIEDDVSIYANIGESAVVHPGDTVNYTLNIQPETVQSESSPAETEYTLTDTLPEGMIYVPGSATVAPTQIIGNQLIWVVKADGTYRYRMSTNRENSLCDTPFGGYVSLKDYDIPLKSQIRGNGVSFRFNDFYAGAGPISFYGKDYASSLFRFSDDGFAFFASDLAPDPTPLTPIIAPFRRDLEIVYDEAAERGVRIAGSAGSLMIIEYNGVEPAPAGSTDERCDFEIIMRRQPVDRLGEHEIIFAYQLPVRSAEMSASEILANPNPVRSAEMSASEILANPANPVRSAEMSASEISDVERGANLVTSYPVTVGIDNADGTGGIQYPGQPEQGLVICFDWTDCVEINYQAKVKADILGSGDDVASPVLLTSKVEHAVSGGKSALAETSVLVTEKPVITLSSQDISLPIPDKGAAESVLAVTKRAAVTDVNVRLNIRHSYPHDLSAWLISPSGKTVLLFENLSGDSENLIGTAFDDDAQTQISRGASPFTGTFMPAEALSAVNGDSSDGDWKLKISDNKEWDQGWLLSWELEITFEPAKPVAVDDTVFAGQNEPLVIDVLANDRDPDGDPLTVISVSAPAHGAATYNKTTVTYTPDTGFIGKDSFTYTVSDSSDGTDEAVVYVTVLEPGVSVSVTTRADTVVTDGKISLREAIKIADTDTAVDGGPKGGFRDTIVLPPGVIKIGDTLEITRNVNILGDPDSGTVIEGNGTDRIFHLKAGAQVRLENLTIRKGSEVRGQRSESDFSLLNSQFSIQGGAVLNEGTLTISCCTLTGNAAVSGGAVFNAGKLTMTNSTLSGNAASDAGGALYNEGNAALLFCTIAKNTAENGGGIFSSEKGMTEIKNTLITDNCRDTPPACPYPDIAGEIRSQGHNLIRAAADGNAYTETDIPDQDPLLVPLADNGGPTPTHAIAVNGPAIDAADCNDMEGHLVAKDQRRAVRAEKCDIGAFEYDGESYPPIASDDTAFTYQMPVSIDVLANDRDANNDPLSITDISDPAHGTVSKHGNTLIYTPDPGSDLSLGGTDTFTYTISDGAAFSKAQVTVTVATDHLPVLLDDEILTPVNAAVVIAVLANDYDPEENPLLVTDVSEALSGIAVTDGKTITYTPNKGFVGTDRFMYRVSDGVKSAKAFVTVTVGNIAECHSADYNPPDYEISLSELLRAVQLYECGGYECGEPGTEDGYILNSQFSILNSECRPHDSDYVPQDWKISLNELLRLLQFYNASGYHKDETSEDGFVPGK
ncbi:MAG: hypothetical protein BWK80_16065 [Desulfobacteraceae bacterium IS3]|nr:MAG: hypothetical protein BWK80_16065 [Desulfobacteraceae bacterium IS3]